MKQVIRVYKNELAFKNWIFVKIKEDAVDCSETHNHVTKITNSEGFVLGYNIYDYKNFFDSYPNGYIPSSIELEEKINSYLLESNNLQLEFDHDSYLIVGKVEECIEHPDSDHLHICKVNIKDKILNIVCGAINVKPDIKVVVALHNAVLPNGDLIVTGKVRGVMSEGMLCSAYELGLDPNKEKRGLLIIDTLEVGEAFSIKEEAICLKN